jgi:hypothetical protein
MKKSVFRCLVVVALLSVFSFGCVQNLDNKITIAREAKYSTDTVLLQTMRTFVKAADEGWSKKHQMQAQKIRDDWATFLRVNGMTTDADGKPTGGTISIPLMLQSLDVRGQEEDKLAASKESWKEVVEKFSTALDKYEEANAAQYTTEQDAMAAKRSAQAALDAALQAIGTFTGGVIAGAAIAG